MEDGIDVFLSIIIPCYNVCDYIDSCINSLKRQNTNISIEFIFINDGSNDETLEYLLSFKKQDKRVVIIDKKNAGVSAARNDALKIAKGKYVYLLDGDDFISDDAVSVIYENLNDLKTDVLITNLFYRIKDKNIKYDNGLLSGSYTPNQLFNSVQIFPTPPQNVYKLSIIKENKIFFNTRLKVGEVYDFTVRYLQFAHKVKVIKNPIYYYVMHNLSATHKPNYDNDTTVIDTLKSLYGIEADYKTAVSFHITAFKIATSFTYNKYVLSGVDTKNARFVVKSLLENPIFKQTVHQVVFENHRDFKERCKAIYIKILGLFGFRMLTLIRKLLK